MSHRVASLLPSATEMVCAVGAGADLVGVSHECDFPDSVRQLPALTRPRRQLAGDSGEIDGDVRSLLREALGVYEIDLARLEAARPDVIVTQDLCDVCAVSYSDVCAATAALFRQPIRVVSLHPSHLGDIWADIARVAEALGQAAAGGGVVVDLQERTAEITRRSLGRPERPRVVSIEWLAPVMLGGLWMPELIERAGGVPLVTRPGDRAPTVTREALAALAPDVVLIKPCGFSLARTLDEIALLPAALPWESWPAVRDGSVYVADGHAYFNRPGPRIVESLEILAACLHPEAFADLRAKHEGVVVRLDAALKPHPF